MALYRGHGLSLLVIIATMTFHASVSHAREPDYSETEDAAERLGSMPELRVQHKGKHHLQSTFKTSAVQLHAEVTNQSLFVINRALPEFMFSATGEVVGGFRVVTRRIMNKSFLSMRSKHNRVVTLQISTNAAHSNMHLATLKAMFEEAMTLRERALQANTAYEAALADLFATHSISLKAFADMVWRLNSEHNINGVDYPHTLRLHLLAKETAKALMYQPSVSSDRPGAGTKTPRRLFGGIATSIGSMFSPPPPRTGALGGSCRDHSCSSSGQCSGSHCRGMCGPSCRCWKGICNTCCWMQFCESHDDCCTRVGMTGSACWTVLEDYMSKVGIACYNHYSCSSVKAFSHGH